MLLKTKIVVMVVGLLLGSTGVALAATGQLPEAVNDVAAMVGIQGPETGTAGDANNAASDQYGQQGEEVSHVAEDEDATDTMTLPNGKDIENHGLAVEEEARHDDVNGVEMEQSPADEAAGMEDHRQPDNTPARSEECAGCDDEGTAGSQDATSDSGTEGRR